MTNILKALDANPKLKEDYVSGIDVWGDHYFGVRGVVFDFVLWRILLVQDDENRERIESKSARCSSNGAQRGKTED